MFASVGAYATDGSPMGLYLLFVMGLLGVLMRRFGLPIVPIIIGVILGPLAEQQLRRALQLADGHPSALVSTPLSITLYAVLALAVIVPLVWRFVAARRGRGDHEVVATEPVTPLDDNSAEAQPDSTQSQSPSPAATGADAEVQSRVDAKSEEKLPAVTHHGP